LELNGADVALPFPQFTDLVSFWAERIVPRIDRRTVL
jgi:hypothetical protein